MSAFAQYEARKARLAARPAAAGLRKRTSSNLFRYAPRAARRGGLDLSDFRNVLAVDRERRVLEAEGLATYETIVGHTLPLGLAPLVTPELKHITIGGATVGIGIESNCFRHGFVHDGLLEAEVLLADGRIVTCTADNEYADLFRALPNSYGTLGYILRARVRLMPAAPYVRLATTAYADLERWLEAMRAAAERPEVDFIEGLVFEPGRMFLTLSRFAETAPRVEDIVRGTPFYRLIAREGEIHLATADYLFRYDPDWFWNLPESGFYRLFRRYAPARLRNSGFYKRYIGWKHRLLARLPWRLPDDEEPLIQDWEVPWERAPELMRYALAEVDLGGKPWIVTPIRAPAAPTLYPVRPGALYFNLGCYCQVKRRPEKGDYHYTKIMDRKCFDLGGIKMLYSSSFLDGPEFDRLYNGAAYRALKEKYDPQGMLGTLYEKCVLGR
ncbi:MAG TPA: FAD-binding oxidoreductase [Burkholderiales bacterium]|nr:FAD-binding oxidoreductase [Burkholderiales bacterium]